MYTDTILKKYSSNIATIFTEFTSAALFGHSLTIAFMLGISVVFISMHQVIMLIYNWQCSKLTLFKYWLLLYHRFFLHLPKLKEESANGAVELLDAQSIRFDYLFISIDSIYFFFLFGYFVFTEIAQVFMIQISSGCINWIWSEMYLTKWLVHIAVCFIFLTVVLYASLFYYASLSWLLGFNSGQI